MQLCVFTLHRSIRVRHLQRVHEPSHLLQRKVVLAALTACCICSSSSVVPPPRGIVDQPAAIAVFAAVAVAGSAAAAAILAAALAAIPVHSGWQRVMRDPCCLLACTYCFLLTRRIRFLRRRLFQCLLEARQQV